MSDESAPPFAIRDAPEPLFGGRISATTLYLLSCCERRLWLRCHHPEQAAPAGEFEELLWAKGREHERIVRESRFASAAGPIYRRQPAESAARETRQLVAGGAEALYQPLFLSRDDARVGVPDFLYRDGRGWVVHDAKLAVNLDGHEEIRLQMAHYARLVEESLGTRPLRLEITNGNGERVALEDPGDAAYEEARARAAALLAGGEEPDTLQGHSVCAGCPFYAPCWERAVAEDRIEVLREVTRKVAAALHDAGIRTIARLAAARPDEIRGPGIGRSAEAIVAEARAHREHREVWLAPPALPPWPVVWFDLEGDPEGEDVDRAIYLWGLALDDGRSEPRAEAITAGFEDEGGRRAWERFVARASALLEQMPEARWVHYSPYEKTWVRSYIERYGAPEGFRERIEEALFDLYYQGVRRSVRLPLFSYSIKEVARRIGFRWRNPDANSVWSIVQYHKARATADPAEQRRILREIETYNADDLLAMRAVWRWLLEAGPRARCG